jgi:hypothetical protein
VVTAVHVVPVGISLLGRITAGALPALEPVLRPTPAQIVGNPAGAVRERLRSATRADTVLPLDRLLDDVQVGQLRHPDSRALSAEWSTIHAARANQPGADAIILLATDTDEGLRSALFVAARYPTEIHYLDDPLRWDLPPQVIPGNVYLCRVPGLDLARSNLATPVWRALGRLGRLVADDARHADRQVMFHLSGGYKAVLPYLMVMAETLRSILCDKELCTSASTVRAAALHESSADLVDVPIRWWPAAHWALIKELARWLTDLAESEAVGVPTRFDELVGLLLDRDGRRRTVNRYGWIMVNMP